MMYTMLLIWFFCIAFSSMAIITLTLTRKPVKQAEKPELNTADNFCPECGESYMVHNDDGSCIDDDIETMDETEDTEIEVEKPEPVTIPRTGKVTMLAENLVKCLNIVKDTVGCRTLPILDKVKIDFKNGMATFTTTNLEIMAATSCGCKIESEFTCVLPFKLLKDLSELLYDDVVTIEQGYMEGHTHSQYNKYGSNLSIIKIIQGRNVCTLFDDDEKDYPPMPKVEGESVVISELTEAIKKVKDKIIKSDWNAMKYCGLYFDLSKPEIVATDMYKMKIAKLDCEPKPMQFRIGKECALLMTRFKDMDCLVTAGKDQTRFDFGEHVRGEYPLIKTSILTQNLQGTYPDYEALKESHKEAVSVL